MITHLRGRLAASGEDHAVIDVQGVGYLVQASARTLRGLPRGGEAVELLIDLQMSEETIRLFGFVDEPERACFRLLQTVQGVGARVALALLGALGPDGLARAVAAGDKAALTRAHGVGARLAARVASELKDRLAALPQGGGGALPTAPIPVGGSLDEDALAALAGLGFARIEAVPALAKARGRLPAEPTLDALLREGLKELSRPA